MAGASIRLSPTTVCRSRFDRSIYGDSPNGPKTTSNVSQQQAEAKQRQLAREKLHQDALNSDTVAIDFARGGTSSGGSNVLAANASALETASGEDTTPLAASSDAGSGTQPDSQGGNSPSGSQQRPAGARSAAAQQSQKKDPMASYDFDGYQGRLYRVFEGTVFEGVVTNHVDGGFSGPIIVMLTTDYYSHDHQQLLLPQGTRLIGNVQSVGNAQQRKLFVVFNRAICPDGFSLDLNKYIGLDPLGTTGLATNVNNHILSSFAAAAAIGGLGAVRLDPHLKAFYETLLSRHKAKLQAIIAVARKLLHAIYGMLRSETPYDGSKLFPALLPASIPG